MPRKSKKDQCPEMVCGIPRANLEQFARFICPYIEDYFADEKNMAEYQKLKASGKFSQIFASKGSHFHRITIAHSLHGRRTGNAGTQKAGTDASKREVVRPGFLPYHQRKCSIKSNYPNPEN